MKNNKVKIFLNIIFSASIILGIYTFIKTYYFDRKGLPEGACPIANNRPLMYLTIGMLLFYLMTTSCNTPISKMGDNSG